MKTSPLRMLGAICVLAIGVGLLVLIAKEDNAGQRDFIAYWSAGQQLRHGTDPYDSAAILGLERAAGFEGQQPLIMRNPPIALFLALPLGYVGANLGSILWMVMLLGSLLVSIRMLWAIHGRPNNRLHLLGYCFVPLMECLMAGQLGIVLLLGVTLFLFFHKTRPFCAGAALLLCVVKPHLFVPFGLVLLVWALRAKAYRMLCGTGAAVVGSSALALFVDAHAWTQYAQMMHGSGIMGEFVPTLSDLLRWLVMPSAHWLQFVPEAVGCAWALWYFTRHRDAWDWMDEGLLVLCVSVMCSPYSLITDESLLLPAVLSGVYRAERAGRSLVPFGVIAGVGMIELTANVAMTTGYYLWTTPAWLAWYLYATGRVVTVGRANRGKAAPMAE